MKIVILEPGDQATRECFLKGFKRIDNIQLAIASSVYSSQTGEWFEKYADHFIPFSFRDFEALERSVKAFSADGAVTYFDVCLDFANKLNISLGKEPIYSGHQSPSLKTFQREQLLKLGIPSAKFTVVDDLTQKSLEDIGQLGFPCVVKPAQLTASLGVSICKDFNELHHAVKTASEADFWDEKVRELIPALSKQVLIEEFLTGEEVSVEGYVYKGQYKCLGVTKKLRSNLVHLDELGHVFPHPGISDDGDLKTQIEQYLEKVHTALGIMNSVTHAELKISPLNSPILIELNCRAGGGLITEIMREAGCCDMPNLMIAIATELEFPPVATSGLTPHSSLFAYSLEEGQLTHDVHRFVASNLEEMKCFNTLKTRGEFLLRAGMTETSRCGIALAKGVFDALPPIPKEHIRSFLAMRSLQGSQIGFFWAGLEDLDQCAEVEKQCWGELAASRGTIGARIALNQNATLVAYDIGLAKCIAFLTQVPIPEAWTPPKRSWEQLAAMSIDPKYMSEINKHDDLVSFGVSISSISSAPRGLGATLFEILVSQIQNFKCSKFVGGIRMTGLKVHLLEGGSLQTYVSGLVSGDIQDPIYGAVVTAGGRIFGPLTEYYLDEDSSNCGLKIEILPTSRSEAGK